MKCRPFLHPASIVFTGLLLLTGCFENPLQTEESIKGPKLFITQSDFKSAQLQWMSIEEPATIAPGFSICNDAAVRSYGKCIYVLERYGADNLVKFDPEKNDESGVLYQKHLGDNWNPQDIEFVSETKAYITYLNEPEISIFNPASGEKSGSIDISAYTFMPDSNRSPNANDLQLVGSDLYVLLQHRNGFIPGAPSLILKIDTETNTIIDTIALTFKNGYAFCYYDGSLYVSNPGITDVNGDGGIERVELATNKVTTIIDESTLGGSSNEIIHYHDSHFYITCYVGWQDVKVLEIDAAAGKVTQTLPGIVDAFGGICYDSTDELLYVGERSVEHAGIRIFKNNKQIIATVKGNKCLPPTSMVIFR